MNRQKLRTLFSERAKTTKKPSTPPVNTSNVDEAYESIQSETDQPQSPTHKSKCHTDPLLIGAATPNQTHESPNCASPGGNVARIVSNLQRRRSWPLPCAPSVTSQDCEVIEDDPVLLDLLDVGDEKRSSKALTRSENPHQDSSVSGLLSLMSSSRTMSNGARGQPDTNNASATMTKPIQNHYHPVNGLKLPDFLVLDKNEGQQSCSNRKRRIASIFQHYYPEGHWGFVILVCAFIVQMLTHGTQLSFVGILSIIIRRRWRLEDEDNKVFGDPVILIGALGSVSMSVSLLVSPLTVAICRRKSTRLTAVLGGLITSLAFLFTSFASQFHQVFFSYGIFFGIGVGMSRDAAVLMIGQYFKRRRELVEMVFSSGSGIGMAIMALFLHISVKGLGWRLGLQCVTSTMLFVFIMGTFYRSASLYHPQRRAILHLKSQRRKIKNKDKEKNRAAQEDKPPYFDGTTLKSRTIQILFASIFVSSMGLYAPVFYLRESMQTIFSLSTSDSLSFHSNDVDVLWVYVYLGLAWALGCFTFGGIIVNKSRDCAISRQYLCQASLLLCGISIMTFGTIEGYNGVVLFVWIYGAFLGGYHHALKMYLYEKVRSRNFASTWSFAQFVQGLGLIVGAPVSGHMSTIWGIRRVMTVCSVIVLGSAIIIMSLIIVHRQNLRKKQLRHQRHKQNKANLRNGSLTPMSLGIIPEIMSQQNHCKDSIESHPHPHTLVRGWTKLASIQNNPVLVEQLLTLSDQYDGVTSAGLLGLVGGSSSGSKSRSLHRLDEDDGSLDDHSQKEEASIFSEEGIADMDLPDHLLLEEIEFLDNITSCNKVENYLMLSEYEQNLIKETEIPEASKTAPRKRSFFRRLSNIGQGIGPDVNSPVSNLQPNLCSSSSQTVSKSGGDPEQRHTFESKEPVRKPKEIPTFQSSSRRWAANHSLMFPTVKRSITVIEENSL